MKMNTKRKLAVEPFDDGINKISKSMLRIKGAWLTKAGFPPRSSVELTVCSPGVIEIRLCAPPQLRGEDFHNILDRLTEATAKAGQA